MSQAHSWRRLAARVLKLTSACCSMLMNPSSQAHHNPGLMLRNCTQPRRPNKALSTPRFSSRVARSQTGNIVVPTPSNSEPLRLKIAHAVTCQEDCQVHAQRRYHWRASVRQHMLVQDPEVWPEYVRAFDSAKSSSLRCAQSSAPEGVIKQQRLPVFGTSIAEYEHMRKHERTDGWITCRVPPALQVPCTRGTTANAAAIPEIQRSLSTVCVPARSAVSNSEGRPP